MNLASRGTGWFGLPGSHLYSDTTKVHFVIGNTPICGAKIRKGMEFQWCTDGFEWHYVECRNCHRIVFKRK